MIYWDRNPGRRCGALPLRSALGYILSGPSGRLMPEGLRVDRFVDMF